MELDSGKRQSLTFEQVEAQVARICAARNSAGEGTLLSTEQQDLLRYLIGEWKVGRWRAKQATGRQIMFEYHCMVAKRDGTRPPQSIADVDDKSRTEIANLRKVLDYYYLRLKVVEGAPDDVHISIERGQKYGYEPQIASLASQSSFSYVGNNHEALNYLIGRIGEAARLEDTTIRWHQTESLYTGKLDGFVRALRETSAEVVSLTGPIPDRAYVRAIAKASTDGDRRISCFRLHRTAPIMNFVILTFANRDAEVLFGYGAQRDDIADGENAVFRSIDPRLVKEFRLLFKTLCSRRFSAPITVDDPAFARPASIECDVLATYPLFPTDQIIARLATCRRVAFCAPQWPTLELLFPSLQAALGRSCQMEIALWEPSDTFVQLRSVAISGNRTLLSRTIANNFDVLDSLEPADTLRVHRCRGQASVSVLWIDNSIYFSTFWLGENASNGPHFLVDEHSHTGQYLKAQFYKMVPDAQQV